MRARSWVVVGALVAAACAGGGTGAVVLLSHGSTAMASDATPDPPAVVHLAPPALTVLDASHTTTPVAGLPAITLTFSAPIAASLQPVIAPALAGRWAQTSPTTLAFTPAAPALPGQAIAVSLPPGTSDIAGGVLAAGWSTSWQVPPADAARLQQLLAEDGYLPVSFSPATAEPADADGLVASAFTPAIGTYAWRFAPPAGLGPLFTGATSPLLTRGALLAFEADHHLAPDGVAGPQVWAALTTALAAGQRSTAPYTYVSVTKNQPETLTLFQDARAVLSTPANTGVAAAQTPDGSWPVYARFASQTMSGTNPDGSHYSDPGVPWISYFTGGDAVHGFPRATYGSPQSVGCVELPIPTAQQVWNLMGYGDIVTVSG